MQHTSWPLVSPQKDVRIEGSDQELYRTALPQTVPAFVMVSVLPRSSHSELFGFGKLAVAALDGVGACILFSKHIDEYRTGDHQ